MSDWRDMIPAPLAAPETAERRAARLRVIAGFVVFAVMVLLFASLRALIGSLALPLLVATATFVAVQGWLWVQEKTAADDAWLFRDSDDAA
jgi:hypothetical protein